MFRNDAVAVYSCDTDLQIERYWCYANSGRVPLEYAALATCVESVTIYHAGCVLHGRPGRARLITHGNSHLAFSLVATTVVERFSRPS
jgi:hypothetical protein